MSLLNHLFDEKTQNKTCAPNLTPHNQAAAAQQDVRRLREELESSQLKLQQVLQSHLIEVDNLRQQERELQVSSVTSSS
jgi:hypothetical protein